MTTKIYHACKDINNMGDVLGPYLYKKITNKTYEWSNNFKAKHLMIAGSILQHATNKTTVLGCGFGASEQKCEGKPKLLIVRGKLTENRLLELGYSKNWLLADPALFLPYVYQPIVKKQHKLGIVAHYADNSLVQKYANKYHLINICTPVEKVVDEIAKCEAIISSSLHGLIVAHAYKIPAQWVEFSENVVGGGFKFRDYFTTVGFEQKPINCKEDIPDDIETLINPYHANTKVFRLTFNLLKRTLTNF